MAKTQNSKLKLMVLMKILLEETDAEHPLTLAQIAELLLQYGISAERKSLYSDIDLMREFGLDVQTVKQKHFGYYIGARDFELAELRLLVDVVQSSRFITRKKSEQLIKKLEGLASRHQAKTLHRQVFVVERVKAPNERIYSSVELLHSAITASRMVELRYFEYTVNKTKRFRNEGKRYTVSPYALMWAGDFYYLVCYCEKHPGKFTHFRVDRMEDVRMLTKKRLSAKETVGSELDVAKYGNSLFSMYGGVTEKVRLYCANTLVNVVLDRFGINVPLMPDEDGEHFTALVDVAVSPMFLGWLCSFGKDMRVLSPQPVAELVKQQAMTVAAVYENAQYPPEPDPAPNAERK